MPRKRFEKRCLIPVRVTQNRGASSVRQGNAKRDVKIWVQNAVLVVSYFRAPLRSGCLLACLQVRAAKMLTRPKHPDFNAGPCRPRPRISCDWILIAALGLLYSSIFKSATSEMFCITPFDISQLLALVRALGHSFEPGLVQCHLDRQAMIGRGSFESIAKTVHI
eukprot:sb/3472521/